MKALDDCSQNVTGVSSWSQPLSTLLLNYYIGGIDQAVILGKNRNIKIGKKSWIASICRWYRDRTKISKKEIIYKYIKLINKNL